MIDSHPPKNLAIAQFIQAFGRQPNDDELVNIDQGILEREYLEEYGDLPDAQQLHDFCNQKMVLPLEKARNGKTNGGGG